LRRERPCRPGAPISPTAYGQAGQHERRHRLVFSPTEGFAVSLHNEKSPQEHVPAADEPSIPELEEDQAVAPRPEEEVADVLRAKPDVEDHSHNPE